MISNITWEKNHPNHIDPKTFILSLLNDMSYPIYIDHKGNQKHYGCAQGYFGQTITLFLSLKRNLRAERQHLRLQKLESNINYNLESVHPWIGIRGSTKHWRKEAEEDLQKRIIKFTVKVQKNK